MVSLYSQETFPVSDTRIGLPPKWQVALSDVVVERISRSLKVEVSVLRGFSKVVSQVLVTDPQVAIESVLDAGQLLPPHINSLIARVVAPLTTSLRRPSLSPARFWRQKPPAYKRIVLVLRTFHSLRLLCDVAAKTKGEKVRWRVVVLLESIKAVCRLMLLRSWRMTPLLKPILFDDQVVLSILEESYRGSSMRRSARASISSTIDDAQRLTAAAAAAACPGVAVSCLPEAKRDSRQLLSSFLSADESRPLTALLQRAAFLFHLVEVACILRPVVFACVLRR